MALNLGKSAPAINLSKSAPSITKFTFGLGWDEGTDLDASVVLLDENGKFANGNYQNSVVFYLNYKEFISEGAVVHSGDNRDGAAEGDDEVITIDTSKFSSNVARAVLTVTSYVDEGQAPVPFGAAAHPVAALRDGDKTLVECALDSDAALGTAVVLAELYRDGSDWMFKNISETVGSSPNGLNDIIQKYS